ncbi:MAG: hypothetical protein K6D59_09030 [Bacteroidales bacterium]|nr:hypothetical protein [Bacteroidales bacterium]
MSDTYHYEEGAIHNDHKKVLQIGNVGVSDVGKLLGAFFHGSVEEAEIVEPGNKELADTRQSIKDELFALVEKGDWVDDITAEDIKTMLRNVLGIGEVSLTTKQAKLSEGLWSLLEKGRKSECGRVRIVWENIVGFLDESRLLVQKGASALDKDFFGDSKGYTNIDKGRPNSNNMSKGFREIMPLLEAFVPKLPTRR